MVTQFWKLGHNFEKLVKGHFELAYAPTMLKQTNLAAMFCKISSKVKFSKLGHSDLILKNMVKGHIELPYATTMLKQINKFSMCSQIVAN